MTKIRKIGSVGLFLCPREERERYYSFSSPALSENMFDNYNMREGFYIFFVLEVRIMGKEIDFKLEYKLHEVLASYVKEEP